MGCDCWLGGSELLVRGSVRIAVGVWPSALSGKEGWSWHYSGRIAYCLCSSKRPQILRWKVVRGNEMTVRTVNKL